MTTARDLEEAAELATRLHLQETTVDRDGRTLTGRIRDHMAGHPRAASYDSDRVSGYTASDPTGDAAIRPDTAAADLARLRHLASIVRRGLESMATIAAHYTPRPATEAERRSVDATNDAGCVECARDEHQPGIARWVAARSTTTVDGNLPEALALCAWHQRFVRDFGRLPTKDEREKHHAGLVLKRPA